MPQHAKRVRISRKSLRQPDEFQTIAGSALTWAEQHVRELLVAVGLLVALAVVVVAAARYRTSREAAAAAAFQGARALLRGVRAASCSALAGGGWQARVPTAQIVLCTETYYEIAIYWCKTMRLN